MLKFFNHRRVWHTKRRHNLRHVSQIVFRWLTIVSLDMVNANVLIKLAILPLIKTNFGN